MSLGRAGAGRRSPTPGATTCRTGKHENLQVGSLFWTASVFNFPPDASRVPLAGNLQIPPDFAPAARWPRRILNSLTRIAQCFIWAHLDTAPERGRSLARSARAGLKASRFSYALLAIHVLRPG